MPDVQEVFRLATSKVDPDPDALERQVRRQRAAARRSRVRAYVAVAAVLVLLGIAAFAIARAVETNDVTSEHGTGTSPAPVDYGHLTFLPALSVPATAQTPAIVDRLGKRSGQLSGVPLDGYGPSLSLEGTRLAFVASPNELAYNQIVVMNADGTGARFVPTPTIDVGTVAISPDGSQIAFEGTAEGNTDIYVVNDDGSDIRRLTDSPATDQYPAWSPDGSTIAYDNAGRNEDLEDPQFSDTAEIYTVSPFGGPVHRITHNDGIDAAPSYSPDGKTIVDESFAGMSMMDPDGRNYREFPVASKTVFTPRFAPDGRTIAFTYYKDVVRRPQMQFGYEYGERPMVILALVDVFSGAVTRLRHVGMASDVNTPQWVDNQHLFIMEVPPNGA
jgi:dipeptidyl aminopeptidase/acylaminoacyl peptidase